jgi:hypothetical protein
MVSMPAAYSFGALISLHSCTTCTLSLPRMQAVPCDWPTACRLALQLTRVCCHVSADVRKVVRDDVIPAYAGTSLTPSAAFGSGVQFRWSKKSDTLLGMNGRGCVERGDLDTAGHTALLHASVPKQTPGS